MINFGPQHLRWRPAKLSQYKSLGALHMSCKICCTLGEHSAQTAQQPPQPALRYTSKREA